MTQPAKVQEPSMEEILASIRRIIADDEAKPAAAEKPAAVTAPPPKVEPPQPAKAAMKSPPAAAPAAKAAAAPAPKPPAPTASNNQDDIDSLLASLEEATPAAEIRPPQPDGDVFELTDDMALPDPAPAPSFRKVEPQDDVEFTESAAARSLNRQPSYEPPPIETAPAPPIISGTTMRAVESAFNSLANTVLSNNARTLEDLVKEMLRPMLKSWLDDNLPGLVERIVKAEIERVSRGR
ncbi:PopZ family protein [Bradyrhizobium genosp. P]|uniref:PopZ family protein n=1 Tax=Bradyrhizobium genosp. P TaxID=83641 RepID=UPI003CEEE9FA